MAKFDREERDGDEVAMVLPGCKEGESGKRGACG